MDQKISICIPVVRTERVKKCIAAIKKNAGIPADQYEILTMEDTERVGCPIMLAQLVEKSKHDLVCYLGDDTLPLKDFLKIALEKMNTIKDGWGLVGLNSGIENDHAHWLAHKNMLEHIAGGNFFPVEYGHCFCDDELKDIAVELDRWRYAEKAIVEHNHPMLDGTATDKFYESAYDQRKVERDMATYRRRRIDRTVRGGVRLAIAEPLIDQKVYSNYHFSAIRLISAYIVAMMGANKKLDVAFIAPDFPANHDAVRNNLVEQAFAADCTHILMMDTDQIYSDSDLIARMLAHNKPVVGARVHKRYPPFDPLCYRGVKSKLLPVPDDEIERAMGGGDPLVKVDATGCGCILYDMKVFTDIPAPWFETSVDKKTGKPMGEDIGFCFKLTKYGYPIYVDCSLDIKHLTLHAADWGTYKTWQKMHGAKEEGATFKQ